MFNDIEVPVNYIPVIDHNEAQANHEVVIEIDNKTIDLDQIYMDVQHKKIVDQKTSVKKAQKEQH